MPKKFRLFLYTVISLLLVLAPVNILNIWNNVNASETLEINGKSAILIDAASGRILYEKNAYEKLPMASLTKIMTALLVAEKGDLDKKVKISSYAASIPECTIYLEEEEELTRRELLYALMLRSANDASVALAESIAGSEEAFVRLMNRKAAELGLKNTHYVNPHGLDAEGHYSSAYDLAILSREALKHKDLAVIMATRQKIIPGPKEDRILINMNRLLYRYEGAIGVKTGYTKRAGNCVVGAAKKGDMVLIAVSMNSPSVYEDLINMLDYGFNNYKLFNIASKKQVGEEVKVNGGEAKTLKISLNEDLKIAASDDEIKYMTYKIISPGEINAPVKKGSRIGICQVYLKGKPLVQADIVADYSVAKREIPNFIAATFNFLYNKWFWALVLIVLIGWKKRADLEEKLKEFLRWLLRKKIEEMKMKNK